MDTLGSAMSCTASPAPEAMVNLLGLRMVSEAPIFTNWFSNFRFTRFAATRLFSRITSDSFVMIEGVRSAADDMVVSYDDRRAPGRLSAASLGLRNSAYSSIVISSGDFVGVPVPCACGLIGAGAVVMGLAGAAAGS